jgi:hypothetical protein
LVWLCGWGVWSAVVVGMWEGVLWVVHNGGGLCWWLAPTVCVGALVCWGKLLRSR